MKLTDYLTFVGFSHTAIETEIFNDEDKSYYSVVEIMEAYLEHIDRTRNLDFLAKQAQELGLYEDESREDGSVNKS